MNRDVTTDQVTGEKTYGDWTTGEWAAYDVPSVAGYVPSQTKVDKENVTSASKDTTTTITYLPTQHQINVEYVDDDDHGKVVKTDQMPGKTDQTITITPNAPANYELVNSNNRTYTVTSADGQTVQIHVNHHQVKTNESKTVTRTINVHTPHNGVKTVKQTADLNRDVTTDQVTGEKTYGDWSTTKWDHYAVPAVAGYVPSIEQVTQQVVNGTTENQTIDVTYSSGEHTTHINYVDGDGNTVHTTTIKGQTDGTAQVPNETPAGWTVVGEPVPTELAFGPDGHTDVTVTISHKHVTVTSDQPKTSADKLPDNPAKTYPNGVSHDDLNKTIIRTIKVTTPDGHDQTKTVTQTVKLTRTANVDEVTGKVTYGDWSTGTWETYQVPAVPGYTPSQNEVPATKVTDTTKNQTVTIDYTANDQTTHVNYTDGNGKIVHTTTITGKTDQTVKVPNEVPTGWTVTNGRVPTEITFDSNGHDDVVVTVSHQHVTVTPNKPQTDGTKLPDNPKKTFSGVSETDLNKLVTRTIEVTTPTGKTDTITQTAKLTRTADVDEVTGEVTYSNWTNGEWSSYEIPVVPGYTPSQSEVPTIKVTDNTKDQTVTIGYTANDQTTHVVYKDASGNVIKTDTVTGKTDQTVDSKSSLPAGWKIADSSTVKAVPATITFKGASTPDTVITVDHAHRTIQPTDPIKPDEKTPDGKTTIDGGHASDLNKTVTRTINITDPTTKKTTTTTQTATLTRTGDLDEVTGHVTYGQWSTGRWDEFDVPAIDDYTPNQSKVSAHKVTADDIDTTINITYTQNTHSTTINYVDENGKIVKTDKVSGHTGDKININVPSGYHIDGGNVPSWVIDRNQPVRTVYVVTNKHDTDNLEVVTKPVLNIIKYVDENGNVVKTETVTGKLGDQITLTIPAGYHFKDGETPNLVITESGVQFVNVVKDRQVTPGNPTINDHDKKNGNNSAVDNNGASQDNNGKKVSTSSTGQSNNANNHKQSQLPQTGNESRNGFSAAGLALASLTSLIGLAGFKKKRD